MFKMRRISSVGGMNRNHRLSHGAKKVTPPSIPGLNPRASSSSFGSDCSADKEDTTSLSGLHHVYSSPISGYNTSDTVAYTDKTNPYRSPGRDSPGDDSSASIVTVESTSSGGCRNSTTSLDSGRASNSNTNSTTDSSSYHSSIHTIREHPYPVRGNSLGTPTPVGHVGRLAPVSGPFRQSYHSSSSSLGSADRPEDSICALDIQEMTADGVPDHEILLAWLTDLHFEEYYDLFMSAGYDMPTISRMTPEDLTAIGIKKPNHRKRLKAEISKLAIPDGLPNFIPNTLEDWLHFIRLSEYGAQLRCQGYMSVDDVAQISIEDLEDVGLYKLGHQKRFLLAIKRIKDLKAGKRCPQFPSVGTPKMTAHTMGPVYQSNEFRAQPQINQYQQLLPQTQFTNHQQVLESHYSSRNIPAQDRSGLSSFQNQQGSPHGTNFILPPPSPALSYRPTYHPDIIRIENRPPSQLGVHIPQRHNSISTCPETPSPPPSPSPPATMAMPQPMPPLPSYTRYQQSFVVGGGLTPGQGLGQNWNSGLRSFDDTDIKRRAPEVLSMSNGGVMIHHPMNSTTYGASGGGTLPRPKGMVKPRPVAKIVANARDSLSQSSTSLNDDDPKHLKNVSSFSPIKKPPLLKTSSTELQGNNDGSEIESFPFANDNAGTIRMRSNFHNLQSHNGHMERGKSTEEPMVPKSASQPMPQRSAGLQRTAGDVLNDIGSMLADLTDELDAMLHLEAKQT